MALIVGKSPKQTPTKTSKRPRLRDAIRFSSKTGRVYITEKDLLASDEFHRSIKQLRKLFPDKSNHPQKSEP